MIALIPASKHSRVRTLQLYWNKPTLFSHLTEQNLCLSQMLDPNTKDNFFLIIKIGTFKITPQRNGMAKYISVL